MTTTPALNLEQASAQSLASGAAGTALLHIEKALTGTGTWAAAKAAIARTAAAPVDAGPHTGLYYGAPALAFLLHAAGADGHPRYQAAVRLLDEHVHRITRQRLATASARMARGDAAMFAEYDLFYGLTGIGALLLRTAPGSDTLADVLRYVISLAGPRVLDGLEVPGWWVGHDPDPLLPTPGGHANNGMAHGAAGLLAFVSLAQLKGCDVAGQHDAIAYLCGWFDRWQQDSADGPWWPKWITRTDLGTGRSSQEGPERASWCYGATGIARALQLAALATGDNTRQASAEHTLAACLTGRGLARVIDAGLCHGLAGVYQTAIRAAEGALSSTISQRLPALAASLAAGSDAGLLTGCVGVNLALEGARRAALPLSGWDSCLLIA